MKIFRKNQKKDNFINSPKSSKYSIKKLTKSLKNERVSEKSLQNMFCKKLKKTHLKSSLKKLLKKFNQKAFRKN